VEKSEGQAKRPALRSRLAGMRWVWSLGGLTWTELGKRLWRHFDEDDVSGRAAQLSFYLVLAIFPLLIFLSSVIGLVFAGRTDLYSRLLGYLSSVMPTAAYHLIRDTVKEITAGSSGTKVSIGFLLTLWSASAGMDAIISGLNVAYDVAERRPWWRRRLVALNLTVLLSVLAVAALAMALAGDAIGALIASKFSLGGVFTAAWGTAQILIPVGFMLLAFVLIYLFAPHVRAHGLQALIPGSVAALVCWIAVTTAFRVYLRFFDSYNKTYGSLGAVMVLLLWLYLTGIAILIGGEMNSEIRRAAAAAGAAEARTPIQGE
jgi:membrane protein